ncbi:DNA polymerase beta superfamily protein [Sutcliffiella horikoshii]|uniref:nucleotidyltransferase domain-containing protein n=1 Tax=Sutcliffiella horikoshii TaxID=79883 RepID=UPI001CBEBF57|nr:nucleotidyltransferase domain-containing protein [Sutcliffiella horikoshii]UAL45703.1 nucleotidyltransferase domain-containing protein [Sutcliffiella horikoshii]
MNRIEDMLTTIELTHKVKILYACEAGSRAYGFATEDSDYDIRFIYVAPLKDYLSLWKKEDTITQQDDIYDIQGWDLKKALLLAGKSNPSLYEWMLSPIVYRELDFAMLSLKDTVLKDYSRKVLAFHYANMAKNNLQVWRKKNVVSHLVHAVRASLMLEQVIHHEPVTLELEELIKKSKTFTKEDLSHLFSLKTGEEITDKPHIPQLFTKVSTFIHAAEESLILLKEGTVNRNMLEDLFFQQLGLEGE